MPAVAAHPANLTAAACAGAATTGPTVRAGISSRSTRPAGATPRPSTRTPTCRSPSRPLPPACPDPTPLHRASVQVSCTSAPGHGRRGRQHRAPLAGPRREPLPLYRGHRLGPRHDDDVEAVEQRRRDGQQLGLRGAGTNARRSSRIPASAAATSPRSGRPTTPTHAPPTDASASTAHNSDVAAGPGGTATVVPRRNPPAGSSRASGAATGSTRPSTSCAGRARYRVILRAPQQPARHAPAWPPPHPRHTPPLASAAGRRRVEPTFEVYRIDGAPRLQIGRMSPCCD